MITTAGSAATAATKWWKSNSQLWLEPHTQEDFWKALSEGEEPFVFVDFFATWCDGCKNVYPVLCAMAESKDFKGKVRFVKLCVDEHKQFSKDLGVKALPYVQLYRTGQRSELVGFQATKPRAKAITQNMQTVLKNADAEWFRLDPNGFVIVSTQPPPDAAAKAKRAAQLEAMRSTTASLHGRLMAVASTGPPSSSSSARSPSPPAAAAAAAAAMPSTSGVNGSAVSGGGAGSALQRAKEEFLRQHGDAYGYKGLLDSIWQQELGSRLPPNHHYLDFTGSSVYVNSQLAAAMDELKGAVFGNPHSDNPSSLLTSKKVEAVRDMVRRFFNAPADEYQVVFTASATGSLKLVGETFPWGPNSDFRYLRVNHNSVLGVREYALSKGAQYHSVEEQWVQDWVEGRAEGLATPDAPMDGGEPAYSLFAFPAEDNFAGVKYPLDWVKQVQEKSIPGVHEWKVLVDAAAYVPTQPLDLTETPADFVSISFYKMFGYPTGLGALLIRTEDVGMLRKVFWGGGSVSLAVASDDFHVLKCEPAERLEDGTVAFLDIMALRHGMEFLNRLGGMHSIQAHVSSLIQWLYARMSVMKHSNGAPMFLIFGKHGQPDAAHRQGGIMNFELLQPDGSPFSYRTFQKESADAGFHVRTGAECNPGACYKYVGLTEQEVESLAGQKEGCDDDVEWITVQRPASEAATPGSPVVSGSSHLDKLKGTKLQLGHEGEIAMKWVQKPLGTIRASLGHVSTFEDVHAFAAWMEVTYKDRQE